LAGPIPSELGHLSALKELNLWNNQLSGEATRVVHEPRNLRRSTKASGQFLIIPPCSDKYSRTGSIPKELGDLREVRELWLNSNRLTGNLFHLQ
ncbi:unnamed protein product, partial [Ectocarpus sp. 12 AP-2014]